MTAVQQIDRFVKELGTRHLLHVVRQVLVRGGLILGIAVVLVYLTVPEFLPAALSTALVVLIGVTAAAVARERFRLLEIDRRLELRDRLVTWAGLRQFGSSAGSPMADWLADELAERIESIPRQRRRAAVARRIGALRYLLPILILLLLLGLLSPFGYDGGGGGIGSGGGGGGGGGPGGAGGGAGTAAQSTAAGEGEGEPEDTPPPALPQPTPPLAGTPPPPEATNPLPDLEVRDEFAVPHFVGEGETRRQLARQARLAENPPSAFGTGSPAGTEPDPPVETDFERAYERALQSRHVPEHERPFLRRYFRILREGGR